LNLEGKNILITGVSGFVGYYLVQELKKRNATIHGLVMENCEGKNAKNSPECRLKGQINLINGNLSDITSLANAIDKSNPDIIFHLAAQSFVPRSVQNPLETHEINCKGTINLLEAVRIKDNDSKIIFAGSSEEYGLVIASREHYERLKKENRTIFPEPAHIPELPVKEGNPLRPMSPYAVSKVYGDFIMQDYHQTYGLDTTISRAFNHEGAGRGLMFVTSVITSQIMQLKSGMIDKINIGNVNAFKDWSHVKDIINGYLLLAENGKSGEVYNQGSMRTNSVLSYILLGLEEAGFKVDDIRTFNGEKIIKDPSLMDKTEIYGVKFDKTTVDRMMLEENLEYTLKDKGIIANTDNGKITIEFNPDRFRPSDVPILLSDTTKIQKIGYKMDYNLQNIIKDQLNYFKENPDN
jgi:GDPmannose 4,6-dehydratase